jgi:HK97 family phage portal protein
MSFGSWVRDGARGAALKFLKIGRLTISDTGQSLKDLFKPKKGEYQVAYERNVWAYKGINAIATALGQLPIKAEEKTASGTWETVEDDPFIERLNDPNPFMSRQDIIEYLAIFLESTGEAFWLFDDGAGSGRTPGTPLKLAQVKEIWPLPSQEMKPIPSDKTLFAGYEFKPKGSGKSDTYSTEEVFHVRYPSPCDLLEAQGAIQSVTGDIASDAYAQGFEKFIMKNLAANIIFLKTEGRFTQDQRDDYKKSLAQVFQNVRIAFMENGLDFATPQLAAKDLPFLQLDMRRAKRILGALGVPPIMVGSEDAKYDNAEQQKRFFYGETIKPKAARIGAMLTKKYHAMGGSKTVRIVLDLSGIQELQPDNKVRAETAKTWHEMGYPLNSCIKIFGVSGMEEVEGGDVPLVTAGLIPLDQVIDPPEPLEVEGTPEDAPAPKTPKVGAETDDEIEEDKPAGKKSIAADKAIDDAHWKRFLVTSEPGMRRLRARLKVYFKAQKKMILARVSEHFRGFDGTLTKDARVSLIMANFSIEEPKKLAKASKPIIRSIYEKLGKQAIADVGASIAFNIDSPRAAEFLTDHVFKFASQVSETSRVRLTELLTEKFASGSTQKELTDAIQAEFGFYERYRAARIARTESGIAGNQGILDGMIQAGVERKRWISSRDEKVRETHQVADGQEVGINEPFDVGGALLEAPGDPDGPAEEIINCRCVVRAARS